jgi:hypothetical protein
LIRRHPDLSGELTDCLIGNFDRDFSKLHAALAEIADVPGDIDHGSKAARTVARR